MVNVAISKTKDDCAIALKQAFTSLRAALVQSLCDGLPLLINMGMLGPDFVKVYTDYVEFPSEAIFDFDQLQR